MACTICSSSETKSVVSVFVLSDRMFTTNSPNTDMEIFCFSLVNGQNSGDSVWVWCMYINIDLRQLGLQAPLARAEDVTRKVLLTQSYRTWSVIITAYWFLAISCWIVICLLNVQWISGKLKWLSPGDSSGANSCWNKRGELSRKRLSWENVWGEKQ